MRKVPQKVSLSAEPSPLNNNNSNYSHVPSIHLSSDDAPIPPKRNYKNRLHSAIQQQQIESEPEPEPEPQHDPELDPRMAIAGAGHNVPRMLAEDSNTRNNDNNYNNNNNSNSNNNNSEPSREKRKDKKPPKPINKYPQEVYLPYTSEIRNYLLSLSPDVVIGDGVEIKGNFQFDGLLRLDGRFQGSFLTDAGEVIVGSTGVLITDINHQHNISRLLIDGGHVFGHLKVNHIIICGKAIVKGDIECEILEILDSEAIICGNATVNPHALQPPIIEEEKPKEPVKVVSINKSKSTKSFHEKASQEAPVEKANNNLPGLQYASNDPKVPIKKQNADEEAKVQAEQLYEAKLEEKRKRKEAKRKEEEEKETNKEEKKTEKETTKPVNSIENTQPEKIASEEGKVAKAEKLEAVEEKKEVKIESQPGLEPEPEPQPTLENPPPRNEKNELLNNHSEESTNTRPSNENEPKEVPLVSGALGSIPQSETEKKVEAEERSAAAENEPSQPEASGEGLENEKAGEEESRTEISKEEPIMQEAKEEQAEEVEHNIPKVLQAGEEENNPESQPVNNEEESKSALPENEMTKYGLQEPNQENPNENVE